jgi:hypothetical protein
MKKRYLLLILMAVTLVTGLTLWPKRNAFIEKQIENWVNHEYQAFLNNSFTIEGFHLNKDLSISIDYLRGKWLLEEEAFPFELYQLEILQPITDFLFAKPVTVRFEQLGAQNKKSKGVKGTVLLYNDKVGTFELRADFEEVYLQEYTLLNRDNLEHATGRVEGNVFVKGDAKQTESFQLKLEVKPPGGQVQARFFGALTPYLPVAQKQILAKIRSSEVVDYKEMNLKAELASNEEVKMLLHMGVPEYNLNLNLNITLRVEDQEAFYQLAQVMGLIKVEK